MDTLELCNNILQIISLCILTLLSGHMALKQPNRLPLVCFTGAMLCYFLGDVFWTLYFAIKEYFPQYISASDISFVAAYIFLIVLSIVLQREYAHQESTKKAKIWAGITAIFVLVDCWICYLLVGGFFWNLMYALPLAILGYVTVINIFDFEKTKNFYFYYHIGALVFVILNNLMFLVSSMGWNNLYIACDFLTTINFIFMLRSLAKEENK